MLLCADREINHNFCSDFQQYKDTANATIITYKCYFVTVIHFSFYPKQEIKTIPAQYIILYGGPHFHHYTCVFIKIHVLFFSGIVQVANNKLEYLVQYLVPIFYADNHEYGLFHSEIVLYFLNWQIEPQIQICFYF